MAVRALHPNARLRTRSSGFPGRFIAELGDAWAQQAPHRLTAQGPRLPQGARRTAQAEVVASSHGSWPRVNCDGSGGAPRRKGLC